MNRPPREGAPFQGEGSELVAGTFKSLRAFRVAEYQGRIVLGPVSSWLCIYDHPQKWYQADCRYRYDSFYGMTSYGENHPRGAPSDLCGCGFYSFYSEAIMKGEGGIYWQHGARLAAIGVVENSGRVLHGTYGIRSERMRILGLHIEDFTPLRSSYIFAEIQRGTWWFEHDEHEIKYAKLAAKVQELGLSWPLFPDVRSLLARFPLDIPPD